MPIFEPMFRALNDAGARYVIVGGLAVVLHGHRRLTADLDLVIDLTPVEAAKTISALEGLGLRPQLPVKAADLAHASIRERWVRERGMLVFTLRDASGYRAVDLLTDTPIPFTDLWQRAVDVVLEDTMVRIVWPVGPRTGPTSKPWNPFSRSEAGREMVRCVHWMAWQIVRPMTGEISPMRERGGTSCASTSG